MTDLAQLQQFTWFDDPAKPAHYLTKTELAKLGLKPPAEPVAFIYWKKKHTTYYLYDQNLATPKRKPTEAQAAALAKAQDALKTCEVCGEVETYRIPKDQRLGGIDEDGKRCRLRVCNACYFCFYAEARRIDVLRIRRWAQQMIAENWLILDLETTGLGNAEIMQIGIVDCAGAVLMNQLIKPRQEPTERAVEVHGITMERVADAPDLLDVLPQLAEILRGREVLVYNLSFDKQVLAWCLHVRDINARTWLEMASWNDLMEVYSDWVGDWSHSRQANRWQRLNGPHDAAGDCLAALACVKEMAAFSMFGPLELGAVVLPNEY
ncbi:3'-5' exonuclease [Herpetosiphon geysericola]|uniref:3'-5' exonuclease n=1 Tax=Herpetosiphon geysericola TaxID=70996 RepID=UPI0006C90AE4|nr:3'-5' exonuclease [Herpetosiphon geysericola]